jgi:hypothetical protein
MQRISAIKWVSSCTITNPEEITISIVSTQNMNEYFTIITA